MVKFRISIISTFGKLHTLKENVEELLPLPKKKPKYKRLWFIISHDSRYKLIWDVIWSFMLISSFFITFFTLAFNNEPVKYNREIEIFLDIMQIFDILLSFITTCSGFVEVVYVRF